MTDRYKFSFEEDNENINEEELFDDLAEDLSEDSSDELSDDFSDELSEDYSDEQDIQFYDTEKTKETAVLVGVESYSLSALTIDASLDELAELAETAGAEVRGRMTQKRERADSATYVGKGKLDEIEELLSETKANMLIFDDELTPVQLKNLSKRFQDTKVIDRTLLILDIFAGRAKSAEGKVQVEVAQLKYRQTHLIGLGTKLSRLGGGIGTRGPGESKLETDRRYIRSRIDNLNAELKEIKKQRGLLRERRKREGTPVVSMIGYTNVGKSTILNVLTNAGVLAENKLFATLDTTTRKIELPSGSSALLTDTVGFIQKLPHHLIQAFRATLEELEYADILLHIVDSSSPTRDEQIAIVTKTIADLGCSDKPVIMVFNKMDKPADLPLPSNKDAMGVVRMSAKTGEGTEMLLEQIEKVITSFKRRIKVLVPYSDGSKTALIHKNCEIMQEEHQENGTFFDIYADDEMYNRLKDYIVLA